MFVLLFVLGAYFLKTTITYLQNIQKKILKFDEQKKSELELIFIHKID